MSELQKTVRPCNLCDAVDPVEYFRIKTHDIQVLRCRRCGMIFIGNNPVKDDELSRLYTMAAYKGDRDMQSGDWYRDYYADGLLGYNEESEVIRQFKDNLSALASLVPSGKLLDVGCATGVFLDLARKRGFRVAGVDFSEELVDYAKRSFNLDARLGTVERQKFGDDEFDAITMLDVIEHIPRYETLFPELRRILRPGGVLLVRTPTEDAWMRSFAKFLYRLSGCRFDLPMLWFYSHEHVNSFGKETLTRLIESHGFTVQTTYDESESPDRLSVPRAVKWGLRVFEALAGVFHGRHKIVILATRR